MNNVMFYINELLVKVTFDNTFYINEKLIKGYKITSFNTSDFV